MKIGMERGSGLLKCCNKILQLVSLRGRADAVLSAVASHASRVAALTFQDKRTLMLFLDPACCYRPGAGGEANRDAFEAAMKTVDVTFQNLDSSEISLTDVSHYFDSDPTKLVAGLRGDGKSPNAFIADTTTANAQASALYLASASPSQVPGHCSSLALDLLNGTSCHLQLLRGPGGAPLGSQLGK